MRIAELEHIILFYSIDANH